MYSPEGVGGWGCVSAEAVKKEWLEYVYELSYVDLPHIGLSVQTFVLKTSKQRLGT